LALEVAGGREAGTGWYSGGFWVGSGPERGAPQIEQDGSLFSLGITGSRVDQQCHALTFARRNMRATASLNLITSVESGFLVDSLSGMLRGDK